MARNSKARRFLTTLLVAGGLLTALAGGQGLVLCLAPGDHLAVEMGGKDSCCSMPTGLVPTPQGEADLREVGCGGCIDIFLPAQKAQTASSRLPWRSPHAGGDVLCLHPAASASLLSETFFCGQSPPAPLIRALPLDALQSVVLLI